MHIGLCDKMGHQGDLFIEIVDRIPKTARRVEYQNGQLVILRGETTGHAHVLSGLKTAKAYFDEIGEDFYVETAEDIPGLDHEDHAPAIFAPDRIVRISRQREYVPGAVPRKVTD